MQNSVQNCASVLMKFVCVAEMFALMWQTLGSIVRKLKSLSFDESSLTIINLNIEDHDFSALIGVLLGIPYISVISINQHD